MTKGILTTILLFSMPFVLLQQLRKKLTVPSSHSDR